jgi:hypothetical protein
VALAVTPETKASVEAILATKRLEEAERLALEGKLDPSIAQQIGSAFHEHVKNFEIQLKTLEQQSDYSTVAKVGVSFQTRVAVHAAVLKDIEVNTKIATPNKTPTNPKATAHAVTTLEGNVLTAVIPTVVATSDALQKIATTTPLVITSIPSDTPKVVSLNINPVEARDYLLKLHEDVGTPAPIMDEAHDPVKAILIQTKSAQ